MKTLLSEDPALHSQTEDEVEIDLFEVLIVLAKRKRLILGATLMAGIVAAVISLFLPNHYTATAKILPPQETQSAATMLLNQLAGTGAGALASLAGKDLGLKNPNDIYIGMLESRTIEDAIISKFDLAKVYDRDKPTDLRRKLDDASDVRSGKDGLISIAVEDTDPKRAADMANEYVAQLRTVTQNLAVTEASQRRLFFEQQLESAKKSLADAEIAMKETQQSTGLIDLDGQAKAMIDAVGTVSGQIAAKEVQLQSMRTFATERNPDYVLLQQQLSALRSQLSKLEKQAKGGDGDPVVATAKVPAVAMEYVRRLREVKYRETVFELLAQQLEMARLDEAKLGAVIQVLDPAVVPDKKSSPKRALIVIAVVIATFFITSGYVMVMDAIHRAEQDSLRGQQIATLRQLMSFKSGFGYSRLK
jgi:uncharacterized protein involved in exopolysaccharide biosynthesis